MRSPSSGAEGGSHRPVGGRPPGSSSTLDRRVPAAGGWVALEGEGPQRRPQRRLDRRLEEVAKAVGGGYCQLQMPLKLALGVRETAARRWLGALGGYPPSLAGA